MLLLVLACCIATPAMAALRSVQGEARDPASGDLLYRELHLIRGDDGHPVERLVLYRCPSGAAFARKRVDYRASQTAPAFALEDARRGYREGLRRQDGRLLVWSGNTATKRLATGDDDAVLVADAGFDEFLRDRWTALLDGHAQDLAFVVPAFGRSLAFKVSPLGGGRLDGVAVERFRLKPGGLLGLVGPSMEVAYAVEDRRLRRFTGLTNLRGDDGGQLRARIDFRQPPAPSNEMNWQNAAAAPLEDCALGV